MSHRRVRPAAGRRAAAALLAAMTVLVVGVLPASAGESAADSGAGGGRSLTVDAVDARGGSVKVQGVLTGAEPSSVTVSSAGTKVDPRSAARLDPRGARTAVRRGLPRRRRHHADHQHRGRSHERERSPKAAPPRERPAAHQFVPSGEKTSGPRWMPWSASFSANLGRTPVALSWPR